MTFQEDERRDIESRMFFLIEKKRPPEHIRDQLDIGFRIENQSVIIHEIRPAWNNPSETMFSDVAKATYVRKQDVWKVYWMRADLKWHSYQPDPEVDSLAEFYAVVDKDDYCCFWG